ncbi:MAG: type IV pilin-like G/H family protein [Cyanobacteria bacterium P01_H01_bin.58]
MLKPRVIIGIPALVISLFGITAIAVPHLISTKPGKYEGAENQALNLISTVTRAQAIQYLQHRRFVKDFDGFAEDLPGLSTEEFNSTINGVTAYSFAITEIDEQKVLVTAKANLEHLRSFTGIAWNIHDVGLKYGTCKTTDYSQHLPALPTLEGDSFIDAEGTSCWLSIMEP